MLRNNQLTFVIMIGNFPTPKGYNPAGYRGFTFVPFNEVVSFPMVKNSAALLPIGFAPSSGWRQGYSTYQTLQFVEESEAAEPGDFYRPTLTGFLPGNTPEIQSFISDMERQRYFLVRATNARGMNVLIGTPGSPLIFTSKFSSGQNRPDSIGYSFQFAGTAIDRVPTYPF